MPRIYALHGGATGGVESNALSMGDGTVRVIQRPNVQNTVVDLKYHLMDDIQVPCQISD